MAKATGATKTDLLRVLKNMEGIESPQVVKLKQANSDADKAMEDFQETNERYVRLKKAQEYTYDIYWRLAEKERQDNEKDRRDCRNAILMYGATSQVAAMVEKLIAKHK